MKKRKIFKKYLLPTFFLSLFFIIVFLPLCIKNQLWLDEVLDADPAYNLAFHHKMILSVWEGIENVEEHYFMRPPVHFMILSSLYKLFGFKRCVALSLSMLSATLSFCIVYLIAMLLTQDSLVSVLSSLLFGLSSLGISMAKWALTQSTALFFFTSSLLLFLISQRYEKRLRNILILLSGITMSLAAQSYQLYIVLFFSFIFYYLFELRYKSKNWLKEMIIFSVAFFMTFIIWFSFIIKDIPDFKTQTLGRIFIATGLNNILKSNFFIERLQGIIHLSFYFPVFSLIFLIMGNIFFVKKFPQHKKLIAAFVLLPAVLLFLSNTLKNDYIQIVLPVGFLGVGFFVVYLSGLFKKCWMRNNKKYAVLLGAFIFIFILFHLACGIGIRYIMAIRDWKIRNLDAYEREIARFIPAGSKVIGGPENWYVLTRSGSRLFLFECTSQPAFNWDKIDYIIVPIYSYYDLLQKNYYLDKFIKNQCIEIAHAGERAYSYILLDGSRRYSGYASIIYKVKK